MTSSSADLSAADDEAVDPLVEACRLDRPGAWQALYEQHFEFAWRTARRLGIPEADAEDLAQDAFRVAWERFDQFRWGRFTTWLYRIVANLVAERLRRRRVRRFLSELFGGPTEDATQGPHGQVEARDTLRKLEDVLRQLQRDRREVFALHELEGLSQQEIAELTNTRIETVRTRLFTARREFERLATEAGMRP